MYALVSPQMPTEAEIIANPSLGKLNSDNPYLRSSDTSLLSQVLVAKMGVPAVLSDLKDRGLGTEYTVAQANSFGSGMLLKITASGNGPEQAEATAARLGAHFTRILHDSQTISGADKRYLFTAMQIDGPGPAEEVFSSRLRLMIMTGVGGMIVLFGTLSIARSVELSRERRKLLSASAEKKGHRGILFSTDGLKNETAGDSLRDAAEAPQLAPGNALRSENEHTESGSKMNDSASRYSEPLVHPEPHETESESGSLELHYKNPV